MPKLTNTPGANNENLMIILDWDMTCTVYQHQDQPMAIMAIIRRSKRISQEKFWRLGFNYRRYFGCLYDQNICPRERFVMAEKWWYKDMKLLAENLSYETLCQIIHDNEIVMRNNFFEFLNYAVKLKIPVIIFSAGIGNFIDCFLKFNKINQENIHIVSNFIDFPNKSFTKPIIHSLNKHLVDIKLQTFWPKIKKRQNILLIGDHIDDQLMAESIKEGREILKIGFLNKPNNDSYRRKYLEVFDIILPSGSGFEKPIEILKEFK